MNLDEFGTEDVEVFLKLAIETVPVQIHVRVRCRVCLTVQTHGSRMREALKAAHAHESSSKHKAQKQLVENWQNHPHHFISEPSKSKSSSPNSICSSCLLPNANPVHFDTDMVVSFQPEATEIEPDPVMNPPTVYNGGTHPYVPNVGHTPSCKVCGLSVNMSIHKVPATETLYKSEYGIFKAHPFKGLFKTCHLCGELPDHKAHTDFPDNLKKPHEFVLNKFTQSENCLCGQTQSSLIHFPDLIEYETVGVHDPSSAPINITSHTYQAHPEGLDKCGDCELPEANHKYTKHAFWPAHPPESHICQKCGLIAGHKIHVNGLTFVGSNLVAAQGVSHLFTPKPDDQILCLCGATKNAWYHNNPSTSGA